MRQHRFGSLTSHKAHSENWVDIQADHFVGLVVFKLICYRELLGADVKKTLLYTTGTFLPTSNLLEISVSNSFI